MDISVTPATTTHSKNNDTTNWQRKFYYYGILSVLIIFGAFLVTGTEKGRDLSWNHSKLTLLSDRRKFTLLKTKKSTGREIAFQKFGRFPPTHFSDECPLAAQLNAGIFSDNSTSVYKYAFGDVILLVSCNYEYLDMLQNWEYMAGRLGLKWAVIALDEKLYDYLGPEKAISPGQFSVSGAHKYGEAGFDVLSCNKIREVERISTLCDLDVAFSDVDIAYFHNPFEHDYGKLILSQQYDYIYQADEYAETRRSYEALLEGRHPNGKYEGNTGFYYRSRKSNELDYVFNETLNWCNNNSRDDQHNFWSEAIHYYQSPIQNCNVDDYNSIVNRTNPYNASYIMHRDKNTTETLKMCVLDPFDYVPGAYIKCRLPNTRAIIFHANWGNGKKKKIYHLRCARKDGYGWDDSRIHLP